MHMWQHVWRKSHAQMARAVPRFENGEEVLSDDEEDHRGELAHERAGSEHTGFTGAPTDSVDDAGTSEDKPPLSPPPRMIRNNSTQSIVETAASGGKMGDAGTYALSACDNYLKGALSLYAPTPWRCEMPRTPLGARRPSLRARGLCHHRSWV